MGQSRRGDPMLATRIVEVAARGEEPDTLSPAELQLDREQLTRTPIAKPVVAWVRYGKVPVEVDAEAVAWTPRAIAIRWKVGDVVHKAWVWESAVRAR
jgi:hypothetical protein